MKSALYLKPTFFAVYAIKTSLVRTVAAMLNISSRFQSFGSGMALFQTQLGRGTIIQLNDNDLPSGTGFTPLPPDRKPPLTDNLYLHGNVAMSTVVHELGHAFDRGFGMQPSTPIRGLQLIRQKERWYGIPTYDNLRGNIERVTSELGMLGRANSSEAEQEVWADMFMTWVLSGTNEKLYNNKAIGWNESYSMHANFKYAYTQFMIRCLISGQCDGVNTTDREAVVAHVASRVQNGTDRLFNV